MYNLLLYLYTLGVAVCSLFNEKVRKMWRGEREAFRILKEKVEPGARYVWFHAASLGEFEQGRPLMEQLRRDHPDLKILLTFFSPSGYEVRKNYEGADIICYLPLDTPTNARRFLRLIQPEVAFFIKYEFWYNYLLILKKRGVPVYSVSSIFRDGQVFFRWYGRQYGRVLKCFTHFYVQNEKSRQLLATIGLTNVTITGDTRFDRVLQVKEQARQLPVVDHFLGQGAATGKVFVAGSSWQPDEEIFIRYFRQHPEWKLIIAPHVIGEDHLQQIERLLAGWHVQRYQTYDTNATQEPQALIIDCFGLLSTIYRYADVCYVGGGFGVGIHNTLEAAVWGAPVIFGPNNEKFQEAQELKHCGGGIQIDSYDDFERLMQRFAANPESRSEAGRQAAAYVQSKAGATRQILSDVQPLIDKCHLSLR
ncbi:MAG: 3-deoxy-D-manno-octulosonic acid transferase [Prevotella sp.]|nr:3-deoxy-D-manno-octulosonic acid transferase [Prevotella sp.]